MYVAEKMHDVLRAGQQRQIPLNNDAVETVIYKDKEAFKQLREGLPWSPLRCSGRTTKIICPGDRWNQPATLAS